MVDIRDKSGGRSERRTQAERSAAMRLRLLDATVECLVTYGYAGTTTHRVAELAGVTRGAQIHHFPAKEDLVVAAIEHLAQQRARVTIREVGRIRESPDPAAAVLDFLWEVHQGPIVVATLGALDGIPNGPGAREARAAGGAGGQRRAARGNRAGASGPVGAERTARTPSTRRWMRCGGSWWPASSTAMATGCASAGIGRARTCSGKCATRWPSPGATEPQRRRPMDDGGTRVTGLGLV